MTFLNFYLRQLVSIKIAKCFVFLKKYSNNINKFVCSRSTYFYNLPKIINNKNKNKRTVLYDLFVKYAYRILCHAM